jgi:hypothetical protein
MGEQHGLGGSAEAQAVAAAIERWPHWLHRRFETISFESIDSILRTIRLDFSIPEALAGAPRSGRILVPLIRFPKVEVPSLEIVDETGAAVVLLTSEENRWLTAEALIAQLRASSAKEGFEGLLTEEAVEAIHEMAREDDFVSAGKLSIWWSEHASAVMGTQRYRLDGETSNLVDRASNFVQDELIFAALPAGEEMRRMLTLTHHESITRFSRPGLRGEMGRRHLAQRLFGELLGWRDTLESVWVTDGWISESLEVAVQVPEGVGVRSLEAFTVRDEKVGSARSTQIRAPRMLHIRASEITREENVHCFAFVRSDPGYPAAVAAASLVSSLVLTAGGLGLDRVNEVTDAAVTLLLAGPTLFASLIALPGRGRLAAQTVLGARALLGTTAAATFIAALLLVAVSSGGGQCTAWAVLTLITWAITALLLFGVLVRFRQVANLREEAHRLERERWRGPAG